MQAQCALGELGLDDRLDDVLGNQDHKEYCEGLAEAARAEGNKKREGTGEDSPEIGNVGRDERHECHGEREWQFQDRHRHTDHHGGHQAMTTPTNAQAERPSFNSPDSWARGHLHAVVVALESHAGPRDWWHRPRGTRETAETAGSLIDVGCSTRRKRDH